MAEQNNPELAAALQQYQGLQDQLATAGLAVRALGGTIPGDDFATECARYDAQIASLAVHKLRRSDVTVYFRLVDDVFEIDVAQIFEIVGVVAGAVATGAANAVLVQAIANAVGGHLNADNSKITIARQLLNRRTTLHHSSSHVLRAPGLSGTLFVIVAFKENSLVELNKWFVLIARKAKQQEQHSFSMKYACYIKWEGNLAPPPFNAAAATAADHAVELKKTALRQFKARELIDANLIKQVADKKAAENRSFQDNLVQFDLDTSSFKDNGGEFGDMWIGIPGKALDTYEEFLPFAVHPAGKAKATAIMRNEKRRPHLSQKNRMAPNGITGLAFSTTKLHVNLLFEYRPAGQLRWSHRVCPVHLFSEVSMEDMTLMLNGHEVFKKYGDEHPPVQLEFRAWPADLPMGSVDNSKIQDKQRQSDSTTTTNSNEAFVSLLIVVDPLCCSLRSAVTAALLLAVAILAITQCGGNLFCTIMSGIIILASVLGLLGAAFIQYPHFLVFSIAVLLLCIIGEIVLLVLTLLASWSTLEIVFDLVALVCLFGALVPAYGLRHTTAQKSS